MTEIWTHVHNWLDGVVDRLTWRTELQPSRNGTESRRAARSAPRRVYEFTSQMQMHQLQALDAKLVANHDLEWYVPLWHDVSRLTFDVSAGNTAISFDTTDREFDEDGYGVILQDGLGEVFEIDTVASGGVTAKSGLSSDWSAETPVYPAHLGVLADAVQLGQQTAGLAQARIQFRLPRQPQSPTSHSESTYDDGGDAGPLPLWDARPNWITPVTNEHLRLITTFDNGIGKVVRQDRSDRTFFRQTQDHQFTSRADARSMRDFFEYLQGRLRSLWVPSWKTAMTPTRDLTGSDTDLYITPIDWSQYGGQLGRRDIYVETKSGTHTAGIQSSTVVSATEEKLTLDTTLPATAKEDVKMISWLQKARLDTDQIEVSYESAAAGNISVDFRSLRA